MIEKKCFVIMPFSGAETIQTKEDWDNIYENLFIPAWQENNCRCERTGVPRGSITKDIIERLFSSDVVFADLTDSNPNVMYELGVRHAFRKPSMMVKQKGAKIPFDIDDYVVHDYEDSTKGLTELKNLISIFLDDLEKQPNKGDNPVWDFLEHGEFFVDYYRKQESKNKILALKDELKGNIEIMEGIPSEAKEGEEELDRSHIGLLMNLFRTDCIVHLRTTQYIIFNENENEVFMKILEICYLIKLMSSHTRFNHPMWAGGKVSNEELIKLMNDWLVLFKKFDSILESKIN